MEYLILIIVGIAGIYFGRRLGQKGRGNILTPRSQEKQENKEKILTFFAQKKEVTNNDIELHLSVSDATAERYLNELEQEEKISQHGETGRSVFYTLR